METMVNRKKLLVTASTFPRWEEDTEPRFILDLCSHMTDKFDVTVLVPAAPGAKARECMEGVNVIRYHYFPIHKWETLCYPGAIVPRINEKKIRALLVPFLFAALWFNLFKILPEYDVVHAHWLIPQGIVQSFFKKPYIVTGHGGDVASFNKSIVKTLKIQCIKKASYVTVVSQRWKDSIQKLVPGTDVKVISMGVDVAKFGECYYEKNFFSQESEKVVLYVGRLAEIKGVQYLIDAMKEINALLVIVGDGPLRQRLMEQAQKINSCYDIQKIIFLGAKPHAELKKMYASADVIVIPSVTDSHGAQEGLPTVIIEAMASGLPIVASASGGIVEIIKHMQNGILIKEKDPNAIAAAVNKLLYDEKLCQTLIEQGHKTAKEHDYGVLASKYAQLINEVEKQNAENS